MAVAMYEVLFRENVDRRGKRTCQVFPFQAICEGLLPDALSPVGSIYAVVRSSEKTINKIVQKSIII